MCITLFKRSWEACSSTTLTSSAAPGRCMCRPKHPTEPTRAILGSFTYATARATCCRSPHWQNSKTAQARSSSCATTSTGPRRSMAAPPGYSSDQATAALEEVFKQTMPREMGFDYIGMSYQEQKAREGIPSWVIFGFSLLFVFLVLAALYESWSLPWSVLLSTPVAVFGAVLTLLLRRVLMGAYLPAYLV